MSQQLKLAVQMLTPLWTAGATGKCDRLHETGIIGSLRWWYEAIVRGLGGGACDPTSENRCQLSGKEKNNEERYAKLCPACRLFGCGGWQRRFRLSADAILNESFSLASLFEKDKSNHRWLSSIFEKNIDDKLAFNRVTLTFTFSGNGDDEQVQYQIKALLSIMAHCGSIGAKGQYGFGQFDWDDKTEIQTALKQIQYFILNCTFKKIRDQSEWYSIDKFWFINFQIADDNVQIKKLKKANSIGSSTPNAGKPYLPVSFDIRYKFKSNRECSGIRQAFYGNLRAANNDKGLAKDKTKLVFGGELKQEFGELKRGSRLGSRVFVSHPYKYGFGDTAYNLHVWGFTEESVARVVQKELRDIFDLQEEPECVLGRSLLDKLRQANGEGCEHEV